MYMCVCVCVCAHSFGFVVNTHHIRIFTFSCVARSNPLPCVTHSVCVSSPCLSSLVCVCVCVCVHACVQRVLPHFSAATAAPFPSFFVRWEHTMEDVYAPKYNGRSLQEWERGEAASPVPRSTPARQYRKPKDDAPAYDPLLWSNTDTSYIATLATHTMKYHPPCTAQQGGLQQRGTSVSKPPLKVFLSSSWKAAPQEGTVPQHSKFHSVYHRGPTTWTGRLLRFFAPQLYARWQGNVSAADVRQLSTKELISLMQLALSAGEVDQSAMLARELSRRKLALQMELFPKQAGAEATMRGSPSPLDPYPSLTCPTPHPHLPGDTNFHDGDVDLPIVYQSGTHGPSPSAASWQRDQSTANADLKHFANRTNPSGLNASSIWASDSHSQPPEYTSPMALANGVEQQRSSLYEPGSGGSWAQRTKWY
ncbi:hypothetical protein, conserved [Leishmania tarentolae]|uniref:Uncharacterized protein n=1 Tax=Leishmania tarentolae TaxID=5689 RepID=A0A640KM23_LEITA|nr:hypothetical protein, conserved [Leishmania tarentolae]